MRSNHLLDYERIRFLQLLLRGFLQFRELYLAYEAEEELPRCRDVESLCQEVFQELRDKGHKIFRQLPQSEEEARLHDHELLCDLVIGACYHEVRQLQENLYLSKLYHPRYRDLKKHMDDAEFDEYFQIGENLIQEADAQIPKNLRWIWQLLLEALSLVKTLLAARAQSRVVLRFVTRNMDLFEEVYDEESFKSLYGEMFEGGLVEALWRSSRDLTEGAHYHSALDMISRLAVVLQSKEYSYVIENDRILDSLGKIRGEGQKIRDNELVSRSQSLAEQFQDDAGTS